MKNNFIKKIVGIALTLICLFNVFACDNGANSSSTTDSSDSTSETPTDTNEITATNIDLCSNGQSDYKIVVTENVGDNERFSATELQTYFELATGVELPIVSDAELTYDENQRYISVGRTKLLTESNISVEFDEVGRDGYKIIRKNNLVFICGGRDTGTSFGVYEFLKHQIGFEPYAADEIYYEKSDSVKLKDFNLTDVPDFAARFIDGTMHTTDLDSSFKYRYVNEFVTKLGHTNLGINTWIGGDAHVLRKMLKEEVYNDPSKPETYHPEWYETGHQLCLTNQDLIDTFVDLIIKDVIAKPEAYIVGMGQDDANTAWCSCNACQLEVSAYTGTGYYIRFCNKVVERVEEWRLQNCPERPLIYSMFAYSITSKPPMTKVDGEWQLTDESCIPHEKLYTRIAYGDSGLCRMHQIDDENCSKLADTLPNLENWKKITDRFLVWSYTVNFKAYLPFYNNFGTMQKELQYYYDMGATENIFIEAASGSNLTSFDYLRNYLFGKLTWDVDSNVDELTDNFFKNYYKDVAPQMRELFDFYTGHLAMLDAESGGRYHGFDHVALYDTFPRSFVDTAQEIIDEALDIISKMEDRETAEKLYRRVKAEDLCNTFIKIDSYDYYGYDVADFESVFNKFLKDASDFGLRRISEQKTLDVWIKEIKLAKGL